MTRPRARVFPPLDPRTYARRAQRGLPFPLDDERCRLFHLARHGLVRGLAALGLRPGDEVLAPAYHHGSEIEALVRSELGCRFYEATETLAPDPEELEASLGPRVRALHLIHYLGFPREAARWRRWCDERGLLLIEDAAQAWLAGAERPVGSLGDLAIFSLYKTPGVPGGGAVVCSAPLPGPSGQPTLHALRLAKAHRSWVALRWPRLAHPRPLRSGAPGGGVGEGEFAVGDPDTRASTLTRFLLRRLEPAGAPERRRQNYRLLLGRLGDLVPQPFADLPGGASPFAFPVAVERKTELLRVLERVGIRAPDLWSIPHPTLPEDGFPAATARRRTTVRLPVHQELERAHLDLMADATLGADGRRGSPEAQAPAASASHRES